MKRLEHVNGQWVDTNNNNIPFAGHHEKDLDVGDSYIKKIPVMGTDRSILCECVVKEKRFLADGHIHIITHGTPLEDFKPYDPQEETAQAVEKVIDDTATKEKKSLADTVKGWFS